ncbi:CopM family metallochaperone [Microvirga mediterraneensis]|jgi:uncharacterized protein (DUF305 family)|uniref:DUF305 domain-containing protein n=1 Tax=Microvirga mediterraneensis TaxID=2754695 RepID=A0A838BUS9_9HYPH|nr:DUF305 domain-containing protein [Microvirga mediterraneensis]MBA1158842.1 DUF305 domain-containing protein [Microvirga mediterraneensis]
MTIRTIALSTLIASVAAWGVMAQQPQAQQNQMQHPSGGQMAMSAEGLPEECRTAVQAGGQMQNMQGMDMSGMQQGMMANMNEAQKGYMETMMKMHGPMVAAHMIKDPDVAFVCGMIPHHQGAIDMARVVLKTGDNAEAKKMAETVIKAQEQEIAEMKDWLKKNAKKEGAN